MQAQYITNIAGTAVAGYGGDTGPATAAQMNGPMAITSDTAGNIWFADRQNDRVRKIDKFGTITTVAGTGTAGYNGDNIPATDAMLNSPFGVAVTADGRLYISEKAGNRIRMVSIDGMITTIAGTGVMGYNGDSIAATAAQLTYPRGLCIGPDGSLYIADQGNNRERKIDAVTGIITTVAGTGVPGFGGDSGPATAAVLNGPYAMAFDGAGNMFITDVDNQRIRKIAGDGIITTYAGNGTGTYNGDGIPATAASLNEPMWVATDAAGNVYIADAWNQRIRKIDNTGIISTIAGSGVQALGADNIPATDAAFCNPYAIHITPGGTMLIADNCNHRIRKTFPFGVGIAETHADMDVSIYPNPSQDGSVTVQIPSARLYPARIFFTDMYGRQIIAATVSDNTTKFTIDVAGIYVCSVVSSDLAFSKLVIIGKQ